MVVASSTHSGDSWLVDILLCCSVKLCAAAVRQHRVLALATSFVVGAVALRGTA